MRAWRAVQRGAFALAITVLVNGALLLGMAQLNDLGAHTKQRKLTPRKQATLIARPKLRRKQKTRRRRSQKSTRRSRLIPTLALPSAVAIPEFGYADSPVASDKLLHDKKLFSTKLLGEKRVMDESLVDKPPRLLVRTPPRYPSALEARGVEGEVELRLLVTENGQVSRVDIIRSRPKGVFDAAARAAARSWRFSAARHGGRAVRVWVRQRLVFKLR
jgi:TonB family protein